MARYWIKSLGSSSPEKQLPDEWGTVAHGVLRDHATFARRPRVEKGDFIVFYAAGKGLVFAAGKVTSHPYQDPAHSADWPWRVDVDLDIAKRHLRDGVRLEHLNGPSSRNDVRNRIKRRSHVQLDADEYERARELLAQL